MSSRILGRINFDEVAVERELKILDEIPKAPEAYDEYGSGLWKNYSLLNVSGKSDDSLFRVEGKAIETDYGRTVPYLVDLFLRGNFSFDHLKMVRDRNLVSGLVVPHRDFTEFEMPKERFFRVFVALQENKNAFH